MSNVGKTFIDSDGQAFEIVWDGAKDSPPLTADRQTLSNDFWDPPVVKKGEGQVKRLYNKTGKFGKDPDYWDKVGQPKIDYDGGD